MTKTSGWRVDREDRSRLLAILPARYEQVVADHVTLQSGVSADARLPPQTRARIVGMADDGVGVQAMVVEIDGASRRPDGGTFHITWSLAEGRRAKESNAVIADHGWTPLGEPLDVRIEPALWPPGA